MLAEVTPIQQCTNVYCNRPPSWSYIYNFNHTTKYI